MEESMNNGKTPMYHPNNFGCRTYWLFRDGEKEMFQEPELKTAQYELDCRDEGFGKKICIKIFSRVGTEDSTHKRDFYTYIEFPVESTFTKSLLELISGNLASLRT